MPQDAPGFHDLRDLIRLSSRIQTSDNPQVRMLGARVHALTRSLLDSVVVDESLFEPALDIDRG